MIKRKIFTKVTASAKARSRSESLQLSHGECAATRGEGAARDQATQAVFDLKATGCSYDVRTRWGEMIRCD